MPTDFFENWNKSAITTLGLFWMAFWAFGLGYLISSMIQVFVTRERMRKTMGKDGPKSIGLATFFGFISSSCSFAALSTTRSLFSKGAGLAPAMAFMLASTNLVIELGIVIGVFLSWQFVVGEYVGGIILILLSWLLIKVFATDGLIKQAREHAREQEDGDGDNGSKSWKELMTSKDGWVQVAKKYCMEWSMVWKDVTIGFTVAGIIAVFVPESFFQSLFIGSGSKDLNFLEVLAQTAIGPVAAFFTFIGSMGNIPLAAVLFGNGVSFAGVIAFIFSDLVVFPVLRIQAQYYGWKMALFLLAILFASLVAASLILHYAFDLLGYLPETSNAKSVTDREYFKVNYGLFLNLAFIGLTGLFIWWKKANSEGSHGHGSSSLKDKILFWLSMIAFTWLGGGLVVAAVT